MRADYCGVRARRQWRAWELARTAVAQASLLEMRRLLCGSQPYAAATQPTAAPSNPEQPPCNIPQEQPNFPPPPVDRICADSGTASREVMGRCRIIQQPG